MGGVMVHGVGLSRVQLPVHSLYHVKILCIIIIIIIIIIIKNECHSNIIIDKFQGCGQVQVAE